MIIGLVFVAAALLKVADKTAELSSVNETRCPREVVLEPVLTVFELALGVWLISGVQWRASQTVAIACLAAFGGVSLASLLAGDASCGCFGSVESSPGATLAFDIGGVLALVLLPHGLLRSGCSGNRAIRRSGR